MRTLTVEIDSHLRLKKRDIKAAGIRLGDLRSRYEYPNPDFYRAERMKFPTWDIPRKISLVLDEGEDAPSLALPRGVWPRFKRYARTHGVELVVVDKMSDGERAGNLGRWRAPFEIGPDQRSAARALIAKKQGIVIGPCASGKTEIATFGISRVCRRTLVIVHTEPILMQWLETVSARLPDAKVGMLYGKKKKPEGDVVVATIQTLLNWIPANPGWVNQFGVVILDEAHHCFLPGTLVGGKPIETIRVGDFVPSYDEKSGKIVSRRVTYVHENPAPPSLVEVSVGKSRLVCTPNHPFLTRRGWIEAGELTSADVVLCFTEPDEDLRVWKADGGEGNREALSGVSPSTSGEPNIPRDLRMRRVCDDVRATGEEADKSLEVSSVLLADVSGEWAFPSVVCNDALDESREVVRDIAKDEGEQPDAGSRGSGSGRDDAPVERVGASGSGRERTGSDDSSDAPSLRAGVEDGGRRSDGASEDSGASDVLQDRYRERGSKDRDRSGRILASFVSSSGDRREENRVPVWTRVDAVKVYERGDHDESRRGSSEGKVYNLAVEETETYIAEGVIVHNCAARTFGEGISSMTARYRWAFTATPKRKDAKESLFYDAFGSQFGTDTKGREKSVPNVVFEIRDQDLDRFGRIVPVDVVVVPTSFVYDLNREEELEAAGHEKKPKEAALARVRRWAREERFHGSLRTWSEMLDEMARDAYRQSRILEFLLPEIQAKKACLVLADRVEQCLDLYAWLRRRNIDVGRIMGTRFKKEQGPTIEALEAGKLNVAVATTAADEGMNVRRLSRGFGTTPVATNPGRFTQQFGRFKRLHPSKISPWASIYFYFWDREVPALRDHARAIAAAVEKPHRVWYAETPDSSTWVPLDRLKLREVSRS